VTVEATGITTIRGRIKRFAKVAGEMVSLEVVEAIAVQASPASLHAAVAVKDPARGEVLVLYSQDATLARDRLVEAAKALGAPELAVPRRIVHMDKIPLLGNGKKDYVSLGKLSAAV
jgi:acyl-[acyl-carrier-protein]-phospholipid O-acyltransferase/long-chain-fatty-acid--[acyl-carrier-protein] ligase